MGQTPEQQKTHLFGTIEKVIYKNGENGFTVFYLKVSRSESITVKGCLPDVFQGEEVSLSGSWGFHPKFGRQFNAAECQKKMPSSVVGIRKYLASGMIKGIGPKFAERIVKFFGEQTLEIIDKSPHRLFEVSGIGQGRVQKIIDAWDEQKEISKVMVFLRERDVSAAFAVKIFKTYGEKSIDLIQQNPYRLVEDIWGIGFKSADQIALKMGLERNSIDRIMAGIVHTINEATGNGHLYIVVDKAKKQVLTLLELEDEPNCQLLVNQALQELFSQNKIKVVDHDEKMHITLPQFYYSEKGIESKIKKLLEQGGCFSHLNFDEIYQTLRTADASKIQLNEDQQRGILTCLQSKVTIITGGPGTGKTTLVKKLLQVLEEYRIKFRLAAPTGRAAKRMFESTQRSAETLHRLLGFAPGGGFARNEHNALDVEFLIVDEASMLDVFLMHAILKALPQQKAHLVLLGDVDQLPSVGAGNVLKDLIASGKISVVRLTEIFRQAQDSMIIVNAHRVNNGVFPRSAPTEGKRDFFYLKQDEPGNIFPLLRVIYKKRFPALKIHPDNAVVLVPMNRGVVGTQRLNQELQMILNPAQEGEKKITRFGTEYKIGDRVMQIRNNYDKFVFNGDMGKITDINVVDRKMGVEFGERTLEYDFSELNELTLSYAISIHKSQGSEFDAVIIPIFMQHFILLQRNLIYTAITRAKRLCVLVGQTKAVAMAVNNNKGLKRLTFLKEFLTTDLQAR